MSTRNLEYFPYQCPHCSLVRNATDVAQELPAEVLLHRTRRLIGSFQRQVPRGTQGGRARLHCPGCAEEMHADDLRGHRIPCVRAKLERLKDMQFELKPKDPDPDPAFHVYRVGESHVDFKKRSNHDIVTVDLRRIADITIDGDRTCHIRVLGRVVWHDDGKGWRFTPTAIGRPSSGRTSSASAGENSGGYSGRV